MDCKIKFNILGIALFVFGTYHNLQAQCYPRQVVTASFATGGTSPYIDDVLWLTWGSSNQTTHPYGNHDQPLDVGSKSRASIDLGDGRYLCIEAEITSITGSTVNSYAPGNYSGDYLDDLYNIGGAGTNNRLVSGIANRVDANSPKLVIKCSATLDGTPIRLAGLVVADAESLNGSGEYIHATADGNWTLVEVKKNVSQGGYEVRKEIVRQNGNQTSRRTIKFLKGNDNNTMAVSFLKFNESAYNVSGTNPDFSVNVNVDFRGTGKTAIALGLLPPAVDGGDAPISYGKPLHLIQRLSFTSDGINPVIPPSNENMNRTNINTSSYIPGALVQNVNLSRLGSTAPDTETVSVHSEDAKGDDNSGPAGPLEEDAWPDQYKQFSYKVNYLPGNIISANIPYRSETNGYIAGWIDFNGNGVFDPGEKQEKPALATGNSTGSVLLEWTIPGTRQPYSTFVRLRLSELPNMTPTSFLNSGEVEDHKIYILLPAVTNPMIHSRAKSNQ